MDSEVKKYIENGDRRSMNSIIKSSGLIDNSFSGWFRKLSDAAANDSLTLNINGKSVKGEQDILDAVRARINYIHKRSGNGHSGKVRHNTISTGGKSGNDGYDISKTYQGGNSGGATIVVSAFDIGKDHVASHLYFEGTYVCDVLEDGIREKKIYSQTCIPAGVYPVIPISHSKFCSRAFYKNVCKKFDPAMKTVVPGVENVPGFSYIRIHTGTNIRNTAGCLLLGTYNGKGSMTLSNSQGAYTKFMVDFLLPAWRAGKQVTIKMDRPSKPVFEGKISNELINVINENVNKMTGMIKL